MNIDWQKVFHERLIVPLVVTVVVIIIAGSSEGTHLFLQFDRNQIADSNELWRLVTAHFVHLSWPHAFMNIAGLTLAFLFFGDLAPRKLWFTSIVLLAILISVLIFLFNADVIWYVGLSGIIHGVFVIGGVLDYFVRRWEAYVFLGLITAKLCWEQMVGPLPGSEQAAGGAVLVDAHLFGAICGLLIVLVWLKLKTNTAD
jgi:rhomboid family GlyGly-CTERM serine protease